MEFVGCAVRRGPWEITKKVWELCNEMTTVSLTMGFSHLLVVDAGPVPIQQCHWEGHHVPRSEDLGDVGLHVLIGQISN